MPLFRTTPRSSRRTTRRTHNTTGTTTVTKPTVGGRLRGERTHVHHQRRPSIGDKISGALLKLKGTLTRRPGEKAAGTRRMHGTDGRGSRRTRRAY